MMAVMSVPFLFSELDQNYAEAANPTTSDSTGLGVSPSPHITGTHFKVPNGLLYRLISPPMKEKWREKKQCDNAEGIKTSKLAQSKACDFHFTLNEP